MPPALLGGNIEFQPALEGGASQEPTAPTAEQKETCSLDLGLMEPCVLREVSLRGYSKFGVSRHTNQPRQPRYLLSESGFWLKLLPYRTRSQCQLHFQPNFSPPSTRYSASLSQTYLLTSSQPPRFLFLKAFFFFFFETVLLYNLG